jgi:RNA polymerase sigma-70 factor (ECF subfamily)
MSEEKHSISYSLEMLKAGDRVEFARLVDAHYEMIYRLVIRMLQNTQDAEDVLQETFIKAYRHIRNFDGRASISTWLYRIATNEALMHIRRKRPETLSIDEPSEEGSEEQEPIQITDWCCMPEESLMSEETKTYLDEAIEKLPSGLRLVFVLRDIQGLSTRETGEILDISDMAVKTRLSRARLRLREDLSGYFADQMPDTERR